MKSLLHDKPHFFKYCTADTLKKIIINRSVKWSSPIIFNDSFDLQTEFRFGFEVKEITQSLTDELVKMVFDDDEPTGDNNHPLFAMTMWSRSNRHKRSKEEFIKFMQPAADEGEKKGVETLKRIQAWWVDFRQKLRVYCVSEIHDDILMWAHYADCHKGAVIKHNCLIEHDRAICAAVPIDYDTDIPIIAYLDEYIKHLTGQKEIDFSNLFTKFATTKKAHWSYEKEWRCIGNDSLNDGSLFEFVNIIPEEIEAIYFGCKMPKSEQQEIMKLTSGDFCHVKLFQAHKHQSKYELEFEELN
jgi:hypothetical protein